MPLQSLLELLAQHDVRRIVDVRSLPVSRFTPHFSRNRLEPALIAAGIPYVFMGDALGGRPTDPALYDEGERVDYAALSRTAAFQTGIERWEQLAAEEPTVMLCAEENPARCHRHLLIARVLRSRGWKAHEIRHIRKDGSLQPDDQIPAQAALGQEWRSAVKVSRPRIRRAT